ncbi:Flp family type IVb pilin [Thalassoglobus sp.]|uniref:Flp family type IVb pilin n=1 Tax=Thalassoglobus sp. TaxID=2795869 RepID=UPI003AA83E77
MKTHPLAKLKSFLEDESGTTSVEYAVMLALIIGICIVSVRALGNSQSGMWGNTTDKLEEVGFIE